MKPPVYALRLTLSPKHIEPLLHSHGIQRFRVQIQRFAEDRGVYRPHVKYYVCGRKTPEECHQHRVQCPEQPSRNLG